MHKSKEFRFYTVFILFSNNLNKYYKSFFLSSFLTFNIARILLQKSRFGGCR